MYILYINRRMTSAIKRLVKASPTSKNTPEFQSFIFNFFTNKRKYRPPKVANLIGEGNRCIVKPRLNKKGKPIREVPKLSLHQAVVNTVMKVLAHNPDNLNRGLLAWHSTGSGKTLTATAVMDAFWETDRNIIYVSSVEGKAANPPETFYANARKYLNRFRSRKFAARDPLVSVQLVGDAFKKRGVRFMTFAQLAHYLLISKPLKSVKDKVKKEEHKNFLDNSILIIDEVHNIFKPLPTQKAECDALRHFLMDESNPHTKNMKMVVLTATPGENPNDLLDLLNMVKDQHTPRITLPDMNNVESLAKFKQSVRGLVSFFDMSGDMTKFPRVIQDDDIIAPMGLVQYKEYVKAYKQASTNTRQNNFEKLESLNKAKKYMEYARKYSNMLFKVEPKMEVHEFSSKMAELIQRIQTFPDDKHYIYSSFYTKHGFGGQGIMAIANVLKDRLGYIELKPKDVTKEMLSDPRILENAKRFVLATTPSLTKDSPNAGKNLKKLVTMFNSTENKQAKKIQLFLASQGFNEGVDLRGVRHIHIFDPLISIASEKQTIGRAARLCSHSDLSLQDGEWTVKVHRYYADKPLNLDLNDTDSLKKSIEDIQSVIASETAKLKLYRGVRSAEAKAARDAIKTALKVQISRMTSVKRELANAEKINYKNLEMIDKKMRLEAIERMRHLSSLYQIIYETAVDCLLFKDFHAAAGYHIQCESG